MLIYNGKNKSGANGDPFYAPNTYAAGQMLFSREDPLKLLDRLDKPFFAPLDADGHYAPYEIRAIVDRFGGGDSFCAGLLVAATLDDDPQFQIRFAVASSALKHTIPGDYNRVSRAEVLSLVKGSASGRVQR